MTRDTSRTDPRTSPHVLIAGVSTRAAAESAANAGFRVTTLDAFGDRDQHPNVRALSLPRDFGVRFTPAAAARLARSVECDAVAYLSSFENHPAAVRRLASERALWANTPAALREVRDPVTVSDTFRARGFAVPTTLAAGGPAPGSYDALDAGWLVKPRASGGGHGIAEWRVGDIVPRTAYLQQRIDGVPGSVVLVAARGRAAVLGMSLQLVGDGAFGATGFRYCGSILASPSALFESGESVGRITYELASAAAEEFRLVGVGGIDFVARDGVAFPIEINPRWTASMELVERVRGMSVFGAHASACTTGELPRLEWSRTPPDARSPYGAIGKAIVFARHDACIGDTRSWLGDPTVRDVPHPGERIARGRPVCTVFADGTDLSACYAALRERAQRVYDELAEWARVAA